MLYAVSSRGRSSRGERRSWRRIWTCGEAGPLWGEVSEVQYVSAWFFLTLMMTLSCGRRPTEPLVLTEQVGELPAQFTSSRCQIPVLSAPPPQPYEVIARVKTYGNPGTDPAEMRNALHREACTIGAQAVIIQPMKEGEFEDSRSVTHYGYSSDRDYTSTAEYAFQLVGLAIRYKLGSPAPQ